MATGSASSPSSESRVAHSTSRSFDSAHSSSSSSQLPRGSEHSMPRSADPEARSSAHRLIRAWQNESASAHRTTTSVSPSSPSTVSTTRQAPPSGRGEPSGQSDPAATQRLPSTDNNSPSGHLSLRQLSRSLARIKSFGQRNVSTHSPLSFGTSPRSHDGPSAIQVWPSLPKE